MEQDQALPHRKFYGEDHSWAMGSEHTSFIRLLNREFRVGRRRRVRHVGHDRLESCTTVVAHDVEFKLFLLLSGCGKQTAEAECFTSDEGSRVENSVSLLFLFFGTFQFAMLFANKRPVQFGAEEKKKKKKRLFGDRGKNCLGRWWVGRVSLRNGSSIS